MLITAALTTGAVVSTTVIATLAVDPDEPTAKTVCAPSSVPAGIVTLTMAEPPTGAGDGVIEPASRVPVTALSSR